MKAALVCLACPPPAHWGTLLAMSQVYEQATEALLIQVVLAYFTPTVWQKHAYLLQRASDQGMCACYHFETHWVMTATDQASSGALRFGILRAASWSNI